MIHDLKLNTRYFDAVLNGLRTWDIRADPGRKFAIGDSILYSEWDSFECAFTGRTLRAKIVYVLGTDDLRCISENHVVFSISVVPGCHCKGVGQ